MFALIRLGWHWPPEMRRAQLSQAIVSQVSQPFRVEHMFRRPAIARSAARQWQSTSASVSHSSSFMLALRVRNVSSSARSKTLRTARSAVSLAGIVGFRLL